VRNPCLDVAKQELAAAGIRDVTHSFGGKHLQIRWRGNTAERMYVLPLTPSDWRSSKNVRADIRRLLSEDGLLPAPKPPDRVTLLKQHIATTEQQLTNLKQQLAALEQRPKNGS
jgi:hypothetical protein